MSRRKWEKPPASNADNLFLVRYLTVVLEMLRERPDLQTEVDKRFEEEYGS